MELREFIAATLSEILLGVHDAQERTKEIGGSVNPLLGLHISQHLKEGRMVTRDHELVQIVTFDVALTVSGTSGMKSGIGVFAGFMGLGTEGSVADSNMSANRIRFEVPISLPAAPAPRELGQ